MGEETRVKSVSWKILVFQSIAKGEHKVCISQVSIPGECSSSLLDVFAELDTCLLGLHFNINTGVSLTFSLDAVNCFDLGPGVGESEPVKTGFSDCFTSVWFSSHLPQS